MFKQHGNFMNHDLNMDFASFHMSESFQDYSWIQDREADLLQNTGIGRI